jgi:hypothetical protein
VIRVFTHSDSRNKAVLAGLSLIVFLAAFFKIVDLDFWWHLKTGQIILTDKQIPRADIYSFTVAGREYIDHEWLFQLIQYSTYSIAGEAGIVLLKCALIVAIYWIAAQFLLKNGASFLFVSTIVLLSVLGGRIRFIERPEIFTTLFLVLVYVRLHRFLKNSENRFPFWILILFVIWANLHAAVILGLVLQFTFLAGCIVERVLIRSYPAYYNAPNRRLILLAALLVASTLATAINPYGFRVLTVPFELTAIIDSGLLNNQEWLQPSLRALPFFYACILSVFAIFLLNFRRLHFVNFLFGAFLAYISLKYVRNVGLFSMMMPLLVAPYAETLSVRIASLNRGLAVGNIAMAAFLIYRVFHSYPYEFGAGASSYFPEKLVRFVEKQNLQGHMLNSYGLGGYLIWRLYPERKVFVDGRNEVYLPLLKRVIAARADNRKWNKLLNDFAIEYAVLNYVDQLERVTTIDRTGKATETYAPFSSTHFPRNHWALVFWDDHGMIFIRRNGSNAKLLEREYTSVFPEGEYYHQTLIQAGRIDRATAIVELQRKIQEDPSCRRASYLLQVTQPSVELP